MYTVTVNQALLDLLWNRRIFHHLQSERWRVGDRLFVPDDCALEPFSQILAGSGLPREIGGFSYTNSHLGQGARIGRYTSIARDVQWMGSDHPTSWASTSPVFYENSALGFAAFRQLQGLPAPDRSFATQPREVTIGHDVWIGDGAMIAPGVNIGDGAIVAARSLVLNDVPPYAIAAGHPARVLRLRFSDELVARFLAAAWWRFAPDVLQSLPVEDPERFLAALADRVALDPPAEMAAVPLRTGEILAAAQAT